MDSRLLPLIAGIALTLTALSACAAPPTDLPHGPPPMMAPGHDPVPPYLHGVTLTDEQGDKIFEIMHAQVPALRTHQNELRRALDSLRRLALTTEFDDIKAKALADAAARAKSEIVLMQARTDHKIFRLLTAEQRKLVQAPRPRDGEPCDVPAHR